MRAATAYEIAAEVGSGAVPPDHFLRQAAGRAEEAAALNAFLSVAADDAKASEGVLAGVPVAVKDNLCTLGQATSCGSRILEGYVPPFEATVLTRLRRSGGIVLGKTNMDEFAMGSSTENSAFGVTRNPHDQSCVPGGSSGGSAAAVAAGIVRCALGSDTGGSVRQPASFCGVVGIKPTYGRVSRYGLVAFASSLDQVGTFGATVEEAAVLLQVIAGHDPRDATSSRREVPNFLEGIARGVEGLRIGVPVEYFADALDSSVRRLCKDALSRLREAGAVVTDVSLPHTEHAVPTYYILAPAEASSNLARYDGVRYGLRASHGESVAEVYEVSRTEGFGSEVVRRIMLGTFVLSAGYYDAYYGRAQRARVRIAGDFDRVWEEGIDLLFTPTSPTPAFRIGERTRDPVSMYLSDIYTVTANLAGIPGISLPIGSVDGLPVGGQFLAPRWEECTMLRAARGLEKLLGGPDLQRAEAARHVGREGGVA